MSQAITNNQRIDNIVGVVESVDIATIFAMFLKESWHALLDSTLRYPLFMLAGALKFVHWILAIREAWLSGGQTGPVIRAIVETITTAIICPTVAIGLFGSVELASFAPIVFTAVIAGESIYRTIAAAVYWGHSIAPGLEPEERQDYRDKAKGNAIGAVLGGFSALAIFFVMVKLALVMAVLGLGTSLIGATYGIYVGCLQASKAKSDYRKLQEEESSKEIEVYRYDRGNSVTHLMRNSIASPRLTPDTFVEDETNIAGVAPLPEDEQINFSPTSPQRVYPIVYLDPESSGKKSPRSRVG